MYRLSSDLCPELNPVRSCTYTKLKTRHQQMRQSPTNYAGAGRSPNSSPGDSRIKSDDGNPTFWIRAWPALTSDDMPCSTSPAEHRPWSHTSWMQFIHTNNRLIGRFVAMGGIGEPRSPCAPGTGVFVFSKARSRKLDRRNHRR